MKPVNQKEGARRLFIVLFATVVLVTMLACGGTALAKNYIVEYRVTGTAYEVDVCYSNATGGTEMHTVYPPWSTRIFVRGGAFAYISAQNQRETGSVVVSILVDDRLWKEAQSTGAYKIASSSGRVTPPFSRY